MSSSKMFNSQYPVVYCSTKCAAIGSKKTEAKHIQFADLHHAFLFSSEFTHVPDGFQEYLL
jgi:hypothetical protein